MHSLKTPTPSATKPRILFVDDEDRILNAMKALFRGKYEVTVTTDGYEALELLKNSHYELLVSDQRMPIMKGVDLLRQAKEISPDTVRVLLTGFSDLADLMGSINDGEIFRFVSKPWDNQELLDIACEGVNIGIALSAESFNNSLAMKQAEESVSEPIVAQDKPNGDGVIVINGDAAMYALVSGVLPMCKVYPARNHELALELMAKHEIAIVVSSMDGDHSKDTEFFSLLKREHPQITSIIIAPSGDAAALVSLINHARVFRYMFKPMKTGLLHTYLHSALNEYSKFKKSPALLSQQKPKMDAQVGNASSSMVSTIRGLRSFFRSQNTVH